MIARESERLDSIMRLESLRKKSLKRSNKPEKTHNYPSSRNNYSTNRKGVGGRPRKNAQTAATKTSSTIFSHFQRHRSQPGKT